MLKTRTASIFSVALLLSACTGMKQTTTSKATTIPPCHFFAGRLNISWVNVYDPQELNLPLKEGADSLPKKFVAYKINTQSLNSYLLGLDGIPYEKRVISVPVNAGNACLLFHLESSGTLPAAIQKKYPSLRSLKGFSDQDPSAELRLDFDGTTLKAAIIHDNKTELISPWTDANGMLYYLLYDKKDAGYQHIPMKGHY